PPSRTANPRSPTVPRERRPRLFWSGAHSLVLASASPRRVQLLRQVGAEFTVLDPGPDRAWPGDAEPRHGVRALALDKARRGAARRPDAVVIGADTVVVARGERLGKPRDADVAAGLALYRPTLARHVGFIDRGELAAVAATLGIAHPTGYPTFTLLGRVVAWLAPVRPVIALDVLAAVAMALGLGVLVLVLDSILERVAVGPGAPSARLRAALALLAALATGVTTTWWQQANGFEVYALHGLLLPLVTWTFLRWTDALAPAGASGGPTLAARQGMLFAYTLGLAFTNHMTTLVLAPAFLTYFVARSGFSVLTLRRPLVPVPAFLLALTAYAYLPLRAVLRPRFDWGDPVQPWRFFAHST